MDALAVRTPVFIAASLIFGAIAPTLHAQDPPTIGGVMGGHLASMWGDVRDGRILIGMINDELTEARAEYWAEFPGGPGLREAEARLAEALSLKDMHYLHMSLIRQGIDGSDAFTRVVAGLIGEVDDGIPPLARLEFGRWAMAVHERAGGAPLFPRYLQAIEESAEHYAAYVGVRNRAEYFIGPRSPLLSQDPAEYVTGVLMWGPLDAIGTGHPTYGEARAMYDELVAIVGEEAVLAAGRRGTALPKMPDAYQVRESVPGAAFGSPQYRGTSPRPYLDAVLYEEARNPAVAYLYSPMRGPWVLGWRQAQATLEQLQLAHGEEHVARAAALIGRAPQRTDREQVRVIDGYQSLGFASPNLRTAFTELVRLAPGELAAAEARVDRALTGREPASANLSLASTHSGDGNLRVTELVGFIEDIPFAYVQQGGGVHVVRPSLSGSSYEIAVDGATQVQYRFTSPRTGPDGALYGALINPRQMGSEALGAVYRVNADGSDFRILHSFGGDEVAAIHSDRPPQVLVVDEDGTIFGQVYSDHLRGSIFRLARDGHGLTMLHEFPTSDVRGSLYTAHRRIGDLTDGGDGFLYGIMDEELNLRYAPFSSTPTVGEHGRFAFRVRKEGGGYQVLHRFPPSSIRGDYFAQLVPGSDGRLYGALGSRLMHGSSEHGEVFRMDRDGTGYETLYQFPSTKPLVTGIVEGPDAVLYGAVALVESRQSTMTAPNEIFGISGREPEAITFFSGGGEIAGTRQLIVRGDELFGLAGTNLLYRLRLGDRQ